MRYKILKNWLHKFKNWPSWVYLLGFFAILALPLLNLPPWFSPPDWGKSIVFRIVLSILIFLFIWQLLSKKSSNIIQPTGKNVLDKKAKVFWPFWLLISLLGIYFLATVFSLDVRFSLWGSPYRAGGFVTYAFFIIFAVLAFLILRQKDWQKIWIFSIIIGIGVSVVAFFQQFGILSQIFIPQASKLGSTIGGPMFLSVYLLLLSFLTLSFALSAKSLIKKFFYFIPLPLFLIVILLTASQAAYLGLGIGFLWFLFFYPKKLVLLKILFGVLIILGIFGLYFLKTHPEVSLNQKYDYVVRPLLSWKIDESRLSSWKVSWEAIKARPILGYGPENFSIGFDRYYDPGLPQIAKHHELYSSWWDRAHNFIFDTAVTGGLPALIIYLLLFGTLFFQLQKLKYADNYADSYAEKTPIIAHGLQATFIGYLAAIFFGFDTFSIYLISFLLIGYSLHLIARSGKKLDPQKIYPRKKFALAEILQRYRYFLAPILFIYLIWFIWAYNIKPFQINAQIVIAKYFVNNKQCEEALARMDNVLPQKSFLDNYLRLKYVDFMMDCEPFYPGKNLEYAQRGVPLLKETIKIRPYYVRNWLLLGGFTTVLIDKTLDPNLRQELIEETKYYLEKAEELSPKRQEVFIEWSKYAFISDKYELLKEKSQKCIDLNPEVADCYWFKGLADILLREYESGKENIRIAGEKAYRAPRLLSLVQLARAYSLTKRYPELSEIYQELVALDPVNIQFRATLAFIYKELRELDKAREQAMKILELSPESKEMVEEFLKSLDAME